MNHKLSSVDDYTMLGTKLGSLMHTSTRRNGQSDAQDAAINAASKLGLMAFLAQDPHFSVSRVSAMVAAAYLIKGFCVIHSH